MLDTYGRKYVNPFIQRAASVFIRANFTPNDVTIVSLILGIISSIVIYYNNPIIGVSILWISGFLDSVDGAMARKLNKSTPFGTLMDVTFDRVVEISLILSLAYKYSSLQFIMCLLLGSIIISMTIFLTVGALAENNGIKSFRYQAGLAERTEGFIFLSLMVIFPDFADIIGILFVLVILFTAFQRMSEAKKLIN